MPKSLIKNFDQYFHRHFSNMEKFQKDVRPTLCMIIAAGEPLSLEILQNYFKWNVEELRDFLKQLTSLFTITGEAGFEVIAPVNKSLVDWLTNEETAGSYFTSKLEGHQILAKSGWTCFEENANHPEAIPLYFINYLAAHLRRVKEKQKEVTVLTDFPILVERFRRGNISFLDLDFDYLPEEFIKSSPLKYCVGWHGRCFRMLMSVIPCDLLNKLPASEIASKLSTICWEHKSSSPFDDDEYWMAHSPFDNKYYTFASQAMGGGWPTEPDYVEKDRPTRFDEN